jgi:hypothetical protein
MIIIRQLLALFVLMRICASLALILFDGASSVLEAAAFTIALIGLVPVALVIGSMSSASRASMVAHRVMEGGSSRPVAAR